MQINWSSRRGEYLTATAPVGVWEQALNTTFFTWDDENPSAGPHATGILRSKQYSLPQGLVGHVDAVFNTVQVPPVIPTKYHRSASTAPKSNLRPNLRRVKQALEAAERETGKDKMSALGTDDVVTVAYLNAFYQISSNLGSADFQQSVFETDNEYFSQNDLTTFQQTYGLTQQAAVDVGGYETTNCAKNPNRSPNCVEGNLDTQYIMGVAQVTASIYWYVPATKGTNPFVTWITDVADSPDPPQSNSMSWGSIEQVRDGCALWICSFLLIFRN